MLQQLPTPEGDRYRFTFSFRDHADEQYELGFGHCPNPVCRCGNLSIRMIPDYPADDAASISATGFLVDVMEKRLDTTSAESTPASNALGREFVDQLSEEDWSMLQGVFLAHKRVLTENAADESLDVHFPGPEIERDSQMVSFHEILPYAETRLVQGGDKEFALVEHYCVRTGCDCSNVYVTLLDADADPDVCSPGEEPVLLVDYRDRSWRIETPGSEDGAMLERVGKVLTADDDASHFRGRHDRLKRLYRLYSERVYAVTTKVRDAKKVGRNDPCPCGSGKKYKKCCLGSASR